MRLFTRKPAPATPVKEKQFAMPRASLVGLLVTMLACFLPHASRLPLWMLGIAAFCIIFRVLVHLQKARYPNIVLKALLAVVGTWLLLRQYGTLMAPDGGVAFLLLGYFLKALEMHYRRDAMVLMLLSFFVIPMQFLYSTDLVGALWVLICYLLILGTLVSFYQQSESVFHPRAFAQGSKLVMFAAPLTIALFLFFPRLPPFWNLPASKPTQSVGLSDKIDMDSLGELFKSTKVAFRVEFKTDDVSRKHLYWRGVVMEQFDGVSWMQRDTRHKKNIPGKAKPDAVNYTLYLEPTQQRYLFVLTPLTHFEGMNVTRYENDLLIANEPITSQSVYRAGFNPNQPVNTNNATPVSLENNLLLPPRSAPRTRELAAQLYATAGNDTGAFIDSIGRWIFEQEFSYTLSPPVTSGDRIDDFMFRTRSGYCSHYASAAALMLRSVGIPARVIGGYQGGEFQEAGKYWIVHQYDAHAWVEYYTPTKGWVMFDPTAAVSPLRIESGMEQMGFSEEGDAFSSYAINQWPVFREIRRSIDYMNYQWIVNVVGYQQEQQQDMLESWFGGSDMEHWLPWLMGVIVALGVLFSAFVHWRERPPPLHEVDALMLQALARIQRRFRPRTPAETIANYCQAYAATGANNGQSLLALCEQYHRLRFRTEFRSSSMPTAKTAKPENGKLRSSFLAFKATVKQFK